MFRYTYKNLVGLIAFLLLVSASRSGHAQYLYVANYSDNTVRYYDTKGNFVGSFSSQGIHPKGIAADASSHIYVSNSGSNTVYQFASNGANPTLWTNTGLTNPNCITLDASGSLYVNNVTGYTRPKKGYLVRVAPTGKSQVTLAQGANATNDMQAIALDKQANIYVTDDYGFVPGDTIHKFAPDGSDLGVFATVSGGSRGMTFGPDGSLYVVSNAARTILKFSSAGLYQGIYASTAPYQLLGLTADEEGNLYGTDDVSSVILKIPAGGGTPVPIVTAGLSTPSGIVYVGQPTATVSGTITLDNCNDPEQAITFVFRPLPGGTPVIRKQMLTRSGANSGTFSLSGIPYGTYDIAVKGYCWLQQVLPGVSVSGDISVSPGILPTGDLDNSNAVDIADFGLLVNTYGTAGDL